MKLGDIGILKGKVATGVMAGVLRLLKYGNMAQLEALAKLCVREEGFDDEALVHEAEKILQKVLEKAYELGKVTEEAVLDGVMVLGDVCMWIHHHAKCRACF